MKKEVLNPETVARIFETVKPFEDLRHPPTFSQAVKVQEAKTLLFLSGQTGLDKEGKIVGKGDVAAQTRQAIENIKALVEAAGGTIDDVVSVTVYLTDMKDFEAVHKVRAEYFTKSPPASTLVQVTSLVMPELLVEITAIAAIS